MKINMKNKQEIIVVAVIALAVIAGGAYLMFGKDKTGGKPDNGTNATSSIPATSPEAVTNDITEVIESGAKPETIAEIPNYQYTETYVNPTYGFSLKYPKDFLVSETSDDNSEVIIVQNIAKNIGVQIVISPFDGADIDLTEATIKADIPEMKIGEPREVLIGPERKGLAFISDNEAFGGASREIWFVFAGNLYQLSAYAELDEFLQGLFGTWEFGGE